jgi:hypothetical protein
VRLGGCWYGGAWRDACFLRLISELLHHDRLGHPRHLLLRSGGINADQQHSTTLRMCSMHSSTVICVQGRVSKARPPRQDHGRPSPQQRRSPTTTRLQARLEPSNAAWQGLSILLRAQQARGRASWSASQPSAGGHLRCDDDMHHRASTATTAITQAYSPQPLHCQRQ